MKSHSTHKTQKTGLTQKRVLRSLNGTDIFIAFQFTIHALDFELPFISRLLLILFFFFPRWHRFAGEHRALRRNWRFMRGSGLTMSRGKSRWLRTNTSCEYFFFHLAFSSTTHQKYNLFSWSLSFEERKHVSTLPI